MKREPKLRKSLPLHGPVRGKDLQSLTLCIDGMVKKHLILAPADLEALPQVDLIDDFTCREGWKVPNLRWRGVPLEMVLSLARPHPDAHYVQASAGDFSISLSRDQTEQVLLALCLNGSPLASEHGGPIRLVVPGAACFTSIKWLDRLELQNKPGANTAETIALFRLSSESSHKS